jgi:TonB family protein
LSVDGATQAAKLVKRVDAEYPPVAKQARIQGIVRLAITVGKDGAVTRILVQSGHPLLVPSALSAVRQWVYRPTLLNGEPVEVSSIVDVNFKLSDGELDSLRRQAEQAADAASRPQAAIEGAPPVPAPKRIRVGGNVQAAMIQDKVNPVYPSLAKKERIEGVVRFNVTIGADGHVKDLQLVEGHPLLTPAAQDAVSQWVYRPTLLNGEPVEVVTVIDVNFSLSL